MTPDAAICPPMGIGQVGFQEPVPASEQALQMLCDHAAVRLSDSGGCGKGLVQPMRSSMVMRSEQSHVWAKNAVAGAEHMTGRRPVCGRVEAVAAFAV